MYTMELKNYQEDVVLGLIDILLEDSPEYLRDQHFKYDVAAYTLNRISPKYFMSERGFTRFADLYLADQNDSESFANLVELSVIVQRGIETVKMRRSHNEHGEGTRKRRVSTVEYIHNFPHIIGRILDSGDRTPVADAEVALLVDGTPIAPADSGWPNPYLTTVAGKGYFSFWPRYLSDASGELDHRLTLTVNHDSYERFELLCPIATKGEFHQQEIIRSESIVNLEPCLLVASETQ